MTMSEDPSRAATPEVLREACHCRRANRADEAPATVLSDEQRTYLVAIAAATRSALQEAGGMSGPDRLTQPFMGVVTCLAALLLAVLDLELKTLNLDEPSRRAAEAHFLRKLADDWLDETTG